MGTTMAQGDSAVGICNLALISIGEDPITSVFPPDNSKAAILCNALYDVKRRAALRSHCWGFAKKQARIPAAATPPQFTYANAYPVPADYIRHFDVPEADLLPWEIIDNQIYSDAGPPLDLVYVYNCDDPTRFDPLFVEKLALDLAADLSVPLKQNRATRKDLKQEASDKGADARHIGSQENSPREWEQDAWLRSRF